MLHSLSDKIAICSRIAWIVLAFECRRAFALEAFATSAGLAMFPVVLIATLVRQSDGYLPTESWMMTLFALIPGVLCLLNMLLWATPAVQSEIEGRTWTYLAIRPGGRAPVLLGKYFAAVIWAAIPGLISLTLSLLAINPKEGIASTWCTFAALVILSCLAYGALYMFIGVVFLRRAMLMAVTYAFFFEFMIEWIPAMVNEFTVQYYLRTLLVRWLPAGIRLPEAFRRSLVGDGPTWLYVVIPLAYAAVLLTVAAFVLRRRQLTTMSEV